jgi:hypothetical protein
MPQPYTTDDLVYLLGQCTVELAWLRRRIAQLEAILEQQKAEQNGIVEEYAHA